VRMKPYELDIIVIASERPWQLDPRVPCNTLAERWSYFRELAASEMEWHGLTQQSWTVKYDHARARAGQCRHRAKVLSFSRNLIARRSPAEMRNTLLHEIAHALAGPSHGHDRTWRAHALQIGCNGQRCHKMELAPRKWSYVCTAGCWNVARFKRSSSHAGATCKQCGAAASTGMVKRCVLSESVLCMVSFSLDHSFTTLMHAASKVAEDICGQLAPFLDDCIA
jgi:predicted SprT family Zn-dependent metalloprotease